MKLRPYQEKIVEEVESHLCFDDTVWVALGQGGGKSIVIAELAKRFAEKGEEVAVVTNLTALVPQLKRHLDAMGVPCNVIKAGMHEWNQAKVHLIMEQSFHAKSEFRGKVKADIILKDEGHIGYTGKRYKEIEAFLDPDKRIYFSATPIDEKGFLLDRKDRIINIGTTAELIREGYLAKPKYYIPKWAQAKDYSEVRRSGNDYSEVALREIIDTPEFTEQAIKAWEQLDGPNKQSAFYCVGIDHAESFAKALEAKGYAPVVVHSRRDSSANEEAVKAFKEGKAKIIVSVSALTVGFDAPNMQLLVNLRPTRIARYWSQLGLRVCRPHPGKEYAEILDLGKCVSTLGFLEEPIPLIEKGDAKALRKAMEEREREIIDTMVDEEPTEITFDGVIQKLEELEVAKKDISRMDVERLMQLFTVENNVADIIRIGYEIHERISGHRYPKGAVEATVKVWEEFIDEFPDNASLSRRMLKTRIKNIIKKTATKGFGVPGTRMPALQYFPGWIKTDSAVSHLYIDWNQPAAFNDEDWQVDDISYDEIPF